tara:strand:+ start:173 stop:409 length:237 start_codon:yes stop_codon:yes gene_type:complete
MEFCEWLKAQITMLGYTQRGFSQRVGIDESVMSRFISGERIPNTRMLIRLVLALGGKQRLFIQALKSLEKTYEKTDES